MDLVENDVLAKSLDRVLTDLSQFWIAKATEFANPR
jgi:hypothetical protein